QTYELGDLHAEYARYLNQAGNLAAAINSNSNYPHIVLRNNAGDTTRVKLESWGASGPHIEINSEYTDALEDSKPNYIGAGMAIYTLNGLNYENGIALGDGASNNFPATALTFYDTDGSNFGIGGLRLKTNDGSGLTTRL